MPLCLLNLILNTSEHTSDKEEPNEISFDILYVYSVTINFIEAWRHIGMYITASSVTERDTFKEDHVPSWLVAYSF